MRPLDLQSEEHGPLGNLKSEGVRNQLGRPRLHPLAVLAREATQNCWDARNPGASSISVDWTLYRPSAAQRTAFTELAFHRTATGIDFEEVLSDPDLDVLLISDRNTTGLGGPTRANVVRHDGVHTDFVDFLRNVGSPPDKSMGGGTFGYGKASLYAVSRVSTIIVYTRCREGDARESRFMAAALGPSFIEGDSAFTGRHWWGRDNGGFVDPIVDDEADALAARLGFPVFADEETGTTIAIVGLRHWDTIPRSEFGGVLAETLLWNLWPKMLVGEGDRHPPIRFAIHVDGSPVDIPDPSRWPPLDAFVEALRYMEATRAGRKAFPHQREAEAIHVRQRVMGWLGHALVPRQRPRPLHRCAELALGGIPPHEPARHIALMRHARLVVRYVEGPASPTDGFQHGNVFVVEGVEEVNDSFARSEPPTHDDWVVQNLVAQLDITRVRTTLQRVSRVVRDWVAPNEARVQQGAGVPLGAMSATLGALLTGMPGPGSNAPAPSGAPTRTRRQARVDVVPEDELPFSSQENSDDPPKEDFPTPVAAMPLGGGYSSGGQAPPVGPSGPAPSGSEHEPRVVRPGKPMLKTGEASLDIRGDRGVLVIPFDLRHGRNSAGSRVIAQVAAQLLDGRRETEAPEGAALPQVHGWESEDGRVVPAADTIEILPGDPTSWRVLVSLVDDANVEATLTAEAIPITGEPG